MKTSFLKCDFNIHLLETNSLSDQKCNHDVGYLNSITKTLYKIHIFRILFQLLDNLHSFQVLRGISRN